MEYAISKIRQKQVDLKMSKDDLIEIIKQYVIKDKNIIFKEGTEVQAELRINKKTEVPNEFAVFELTLDGE